VGVDADDIDDLAALALPQLDLLRHRLHFLQQLRRVGVQVGAELGQGEVAGR
jgi:hypothetical protein